jgi:hypothetical protein
VRDGYLYFYIAVCDKGLINLGDWTFKCAKVFLIADFEPFGLGTNGKVSYFKG